MSTRLNLTGLLKVRITETEPNSNPNTNPNPNLTLLNPLTLLTLPNSTIRRCTVSVGTGKLDVVCETLGDPNSTSFSGTVISITAETRMWANAQRDGRPAKYRWRPLFNTAVWLTPTTRVPCSNVAKTRKPLKFAGVSQTRQQISTISRPKFTIL